jgi:hypothetical protein
VAWFPSSSSFSFPTISTQRRQTTPRLGCVLAHHLISVLSSLSPRTSTSNRKPARGGIESRNVPSKIFCWLACEHAPLHSRKPFPNATPVRPMSCSVRPQPPALLMLRKGLDCVPLSPKCTVVVGEDGAPLGRARKVGAGAGAGGGRRNTGAMTWMGSGLVGDEDVEAETDGTCGETETVAALAPSVPTPVQPLLSVHAQASSVGAPPAFSLDDVDRLGCARMGRGGGVGHWHVSLAFLLGGLIHYSITGRLLRRRT